MLEAVWSGAAVLKRQNADPLAFSWPLTHTLHVPHPNISVSIGPKSRILVSALLNNGPVGVKKGPKPLFWDGAVVLGGLPLSFLDLLKYPLSVPLLTPLPQYLPTTSQAFS